MADDRMRRRRERAARALIMRRREKGLTQEALAHRAGVVVRTISGIENGKWPNARTRALVEDALDWPPGEIERQADGGLRVVNARDRALLRRAIHDDDDFRRVIGVLEGTVIVIEPDGDESQNGSAAG